MAYGKIKADTLVYDNSGSDVEVTLSSLGNKANLASPTFTGTVTIPTPAANDNTTKAASTAYVQTELGDYLTTATATSTYAPKASPTFTGTVNAAALTLSGDLTVNGTTTTIDSTTLDVEDKNITLGKVSSPSNTTANGGGITLLGSTNKTFNWESSTGAWKSSEDIHLGDSKKATFGDGQDLKIFHNGTNNYIDVEGDGVLYVRPKANFYLQNYTTGEVSIAAIPDGTTELYHNGVKKIETTAAGVTVSGSVTDDKGPLRRIVQAYKSSAHTLVVGDAGKCIQIATGGVTVNQSIFTEGDAVTIVNHSGSDQTITQGSSFTLYNTADGSTGNRTLAGRGMATMWFANHNVAYISGAGLS